MTYTSDALSSIRRTIGARGWGEDSESRSFSTPRGTGNGEEEDGSQTSSRLDSDPATVALHDPLADCQTHSATLEFIPGMTPYKKTGRGETNPICLRPGKLIVHP